MRISPAVKPMHKAVHARPGVEDIDRAQDFAFFGEIDLDGVVHAASAVEADIGTVRAAGEDIRAFPFAGNFSLLVAELVPMIAVAPIEPTIGTEKAAVDVGGISRVTEFAHELVPLVGDAIVIRVLQPPY